MIKKLALVTVLFAAAGPLAGCADEPAPTDVSLHQALSCEDLETQLKDDALVKMNAYIDAQIAMHQRGLNEFVSGTEQNDGWQNGISSSVSSSASGGAVPPQSGGALDDPGGGGGQPPPEHSETNNQVEGVHEADIVKTDGNYLYALHGQSLAVMSSWPVSELAMDSEVTIEGHPIEMFLREGQVVVYSQVSVEDVFGRAGLGVPQAVSDYDYYYAPQMTKVTVLSVSDTASPTVQKELYFEGHYLSARRIGAQVRTVLSGGYHLPQLSYFPEMAYEDWPESPQQWVAAYEQLRIRNSALINQATLKDFLPQRFASQADGSLAALQPGCTDYFVPRPGTAAYGITQIQAFDLDALDVEPAQTQIVGQAQHVYSSAEAMYLAGASWDNPFYRTHRFNAPVSLTSTHLHKFDIATEPTRALYQGSGKVAGHVHDQFSMDERDDQLRIATTDVRSSFEGGSERLNHLFVVEQQGAQLAVIGSVKGLAPNEQVFSARFIADRGYVVTFRQVDPLFVIDLSEPTAPVVTAELKIPGFSDYMHPLGDHHLLTIGRDGTDGGQVLNTALQIFDVSDDHNPKLVHKHVLDEGYSEAEDNHKAFTFYQGKLAIPMLSYGNDGIDSTLQLFDVDAEQGIVPLGSVDHSAFFDTLADPYCYPYHLGVRRGVFIEDYVYSVSEGGVLVTPVNDMQAIVASLAFSQPELDYDCYY